MRKGSRRRQPRRLPAGLIAAGLLIFGVAALALPRMQALRAADEPEPALAAAPLEWPFDDATDEPTGVPTEPARPVQLTRPAKEPPAPAPAPVAPDPQAVNRAPAPQEAGSALRAKPVSGSSGIGAVPIAPVKPTLALVGDDSRLAGFFEALGGEIGGRGVNVRRAAPTDTGRADLLLVVGVSDAPEARVWYCDDGATADESFASALLGVVLPTGPTDSPGGETASALPASFSCDVVRGAATGPAALLELPASAIDAGEGARVEISRLSQAIAAQARASASTSSALMAGVRLAWPAHGPVTSHYGPQHPLGIDIGQWEGDILAATDGVVTWAGGDACCGYGRYVIIDSGRGVQTVYGHLETLRVKQGQRVLRGQALGVVGCTGHCSGPHLHFEVIVNGARRDPMRYLP